MNVPALLVRLYPPAIRQRWGSEIEHEARLAGPRSWFDTAAGATKAWLHPSDWPETSAGQTRRVLAVALVAVATTAGLLLRAAGPTPLTANVGHPVTSAWAAPILLGLALATPLPPLRWAAIARLAVVTARTLTAPALAFLALYLIAHSGRAAHATGGPHLLLLLGYWATLGFAGVRLCLVVARVGRTAVLPGAHRLRLALLCTGTGLVFAAAQVLASADGAGAVLLSAALTALAAPPLVAGLDLRGVPAP